MRKNIAVVILAAGLGTRMKSDKAKVLHEVAERPYDCLCGRSCSRSGR